MGTKARANKTDPAEYRRYLETRLSQTRARIKMADAVTGITIVIVAWVSYLLVAVMADQLVELSVTVRFLLLSACLLATGSILVLKVILPSWKQVNTRFAARSIEAADQRMKNSVLSYVELSERSDDLPAPILRTIENKAASDLSRVRIEDAIQPRHVLSAVYFMAAVVVLFCLYSFFTTKSFGASIERVLLPLGATSPPTSTQLRIVFDPGANDPTEPAPIPADSAITFKASVIRGNPNQVMAYLQAEGSDYEEPHELARSESVKSEFTLTLHQRQKTFNVRFVADDFRSKQYQVVVTPAPMITQWLLRYTPPAYTGEEPFTATTPDITGLEGTEVNVEATTNLPIAENSSRIEFKLAKPTASVDMKLVDGAENKISGQFLLTGDGSYSVLFSDREGRSPLFRPSNNIRVLKDLAPVVEFIQPAEKDSSLPANRPLHLVARVKDDYGLRGYTLTIRKRGSEESPIIFEQGNLPGVSLERNESINETVDLSRWKLGDGDVVEYWIEAEDNKLPASNITDTRKESRLVRITKPIEEQPLAKNDQQQNSSGDSKPSPQGERKENEPSSEVASTEQDQHSAGTDSNGRENDSKSNEEAASEKNKPNTAQGQSSDSDNETKNGSEKDRDAKQEQDALRKEMQRENNSGDSNPQQEQGKSQDRSNKGDSPSKTDEKQESEDEKDLEKLREYFQKESGKSSDGKQRESDPSSNGSNHREGETAPPRSDGSSKGGETENKEKPSEVPSKSSESEPTSTSASGSDKDDSKAPSEGKTDEKNSTRGDEAKENPKASSENTDKKNGDGSAKSGDAKENSDQHPNGDSVKGEEPNNSGTGEGKSSKKNEKSPSREGSNPNNAAKKETSETGDKKESPSNEKTPDSSKPTSESPQKDSESAEKKTESSDQKPPSSEAKAERGEKNRENSTQEREKPSEPNTGRQSNDQSQQKSGGNNSKNSSQEGGNDSSSKESSPTSSEKGTPQNSQEQKPGGNEQPNSGDQNQTKAGSEAKPNANGEQQSSGGEKQSGQESQSGDSGSNSKSSDQGKQNKESGEGKPTSASDDSNQSRNRSTKMGNNESSAASKGNSDGSSQEGPSQSPGQKGPGSPSDQKGNESKGSGNEQRTPGENGTPSEKESSQGGKETESSSSPENDSGKQSSSDAKSGEPSNPSSSEQGKSSPQQGKESSNSEGSPSSGGEQQKPGSNGDASKNQGQGQQQGGSPSNSSESSSPMNENPSNSKSDSSSPQGKSDQKEDSKKSDNGSAGSSSEQNKDQQNSKPPQNSSSSGNQQPQNATPSSNSSAGGANDAQSNSPTSTPHGGNKPNPSGNTKGEGTPIDNTGDAPDQDDLKKGSNLILKKLEEQLANKKVDPDLLKSMGWTEADARKFYERMNREKPAENVSPLGQEQRRQFGQGTDLRKSTGKSAGKTNDTVQDLYSGKRTPVPPQVRKRFEAYMKSLSETSGAKPAEKAPAPPTGTK